MHTSIFANHKNKSIVEIIAHIIFVVCALVAVMAVFAITAYMIINGSPALFKVGIREILFNTKWAPAAVEPHFGILYVILTSIVGTFAAILLGVPVALLTAVFLAEVAPKEAGGHCKTCSYPFGRYSLRYLRTFGNPDLKSTDV